MAAIHQSSGQGALFELVARGVKDTYFVKDSEKSYFPYDARYHASIPHLGEHRTMIPVNAPTFGGTFEVEIDKYGDIMTEVTLEIDLPTWFPPLPPFPGSNPCKAETVNGLYVITSTVGDSYGYVNGVGYFLFESIQLYQDQFLLQEWTGDGLFVKQLTESSYSRGTLNQVLSGFHSNSVRDIQLHATPGHLSIILPLPGTQCPEDPGFPIAALPWQTFRIKATLRKIEDLIISSNPTTVKPAPWTVPEFTYTFDDGTSYTFAPISLHDLERPTIVVSTTQHYVPPEVQGKMRAMKMEIPFRRQFENRFTFGELDFISLDKGGTSTVTRRVDGRHPTERLLWFFRNTNAMDRNRLDAFTNDYFETHPATAAQPFTQPYGEFYYRLKLTIAGKDREDLYEPLVWNTITAHAKQERASIMRGIGSMDWSTGEKYGVVYPTARLPEGTVNFTTADRPTFYIELANITTNPLLKQRKAEMRVLTEGWSVYVVERGRGRLLFSN